MEHQQSFSFYLPSAQQGFSQQHSGPFLSHYIHFSGLELFGQSEISSSLPLLRYTALQSQETNMEIGAGGSVVFSVNPPSPLESDLCADDQESILKTWHTGGNGGGNMNESSSGTDSSVAETHTRFEPDMMDHGMRMGSMSSSTNANPLNLSGRAQSHGGSRSTGGSSSSGKRATGSGAGGRSSSSESHRKSELYKTELCVSVNTGIPCKYGDNCQFAHSRQELQHVTRHPRYKTQFCTSFQSQGFCKYNDRCTFIHHPEEARVPLSTIARRGSAASSSSATSIHYDSTSGPGTVNLGLTAAEIKNGERSRALSDPGRAFTAVPMVLRSASTSVAATTCIPAMNDFEKLHRSSSQVCVGYSDVPTVMCEQHDRFGAAHSDLPSSPSTSSVRPQQQRMAINSHSSDAISDATAAIENHYGVSSHLAAMDYKTVSDVLLFDAQSDGRFPNIVDMAFSHKHATRTTTVPMTRVSPLHQGASDPWSEIAEVDNDEEWATKLAYYITTPHNDFDI
ncbi:hypothetical protein EDD11_002824 [Mortierella claussenii]|nr:hypothetical protein EDD11_002824 [Mortierella claussenii]